MAASWMELCFRQNPGTIVQHDVMVYNGQVYSGREDPA